MRQPDAAILVDMLLFARRIDAKIRAVGREEFDEDEDLQLALTHLIQIVGEAASRSSEELRKQYPAIPWVQIIGMRHRIVHDYLRVRTDVVWETAISDIRPLIALLEEIVGEDG